MDGIAQALLGELSSLSQELQTVGSARPRLDQRLATLTDKSSSLAAEIRQVEQSINAAVMNEEKAAALEDSNAQAIRVQGRLSFCLESLQPNDAINTLKFKVRHLQAKLDQLILEAGTDDDAEARMHSVLTNISSTMTSLIAKFKPFFWEFPFWLDMRDLTVVVQRPGNPVPTKRTPNLL